MPLPTQKDVRLVNPVLTNLSLGYRNERFLWSKLAPELKVDQQTGTIPILTKDYWFRRAATAARAQDGGYVRVGYGIESDTYGCKEIGFEKLIDDPTRKASQFPESLDIVDTRFLTNLMELELEKLVAAACFVTSVWGTSTTLTSTDQWSDFDGSDPITKIDTATLTIKRNTGRKANTIFIGNSAWLKLKEHPLIIDKYKYTQRGIMTPELVAAVLDVQEIVVGDSVENTAAEKVPGTASFTGSDIWTDNCLIFLKEPAGQGVANGAATIMWDEAGNVPWAVQSYRDEKVRGDVNRIFTHQSVKILSTQSGYIYLDCIA
ncbi:MAG: major capsid protein [Dehalococcoidales bacterium]|nr:major capsid protein [Dehalococcoidales bacterium]